MPYPPTDEEQDQEQQGLAIPRLRKATIPPLVSPPSVGSPQAGSQPAPPQDDYGRAIQQMQQDAAARRATLSVPMPEAHGARKVAGIATSIIGSLINPTIGGMGQKLLHPGLDRWQQERENAKAMEGMDESQASRLAQVAQIQSTRERDRMANEDRDLARTDRMNTGQQNQITQLSNPNTYGGEIIPGNIPSAPAPQRLAVPGQPISPTNLPGPAGLAIPGATSAEQVNPASGKPYGEEGTIQEIKGAPGTPSVTMLLPNQATRQARTDAKARSAALIKREEEQKDYVPVTQQMIERLPSLGLKVGDKVPRAEAVKFAELADSPDREVTNEYMGTLKEFTKPDGTVDFKAANRAFEQRQQSRRPVNQFAPIAGMPNSQPTGDSQVDTVLAKYPEPVVRLAKQFLSFDAPAPTSRSLGSPLIAGAIQAAKEANPAFDVKQYATQQQMYKAFTSGKPSTEINAINVTLGHLGNLNDAIEALNNGDAQALNRLANFVGAQTGKDALTTYEAIVHRVAPETVRAYVGTGGDVADRAKAEADFSASRSPQQLRSAVGIAAKLLGSKIDTTMQQWKGLMGNKPFPLQGGTVLTPDAQAVLDRIGGKSSGSSASLPTVKTQAEYDALPRGSFYMEDGKKMKKP